MGKSRLHLRIEWLLLAPLSAITAMNMDKETFEVADVQGNLLPCRYATEGI